MEPSDSITLGPDIGTFLVSHPQVIGLACQSGTSVDHPSVKVGVPFEADLDTVDSALVLVGVFGTVVMCQQSFRPILVYTFDHNWIWRPNILLVV